jgi:phage gp29-like protein
MDPRNLETDANRSGMHGPTPILERIKRMGSALLGKTPSKELTEEEARPELAGVRTLWDQSVASGLTPHRLAGILQSAIAGDHRPYLALAEEMEERDPHYGSVLGTRKRSLSRLSPCVEPPSAKRAEKKIADAVRDLVEAPAFRDMLRDLTDAFGKGFSVIELVWREEGGLWKPAYVWRDPKYFTFDHISRSELRLAELGSIDGLAMAPGKWIVHTPKVKSGIPIRGGYGRLAAWAYLFKNYSLKDWAAFLDVYGMPIRVGKYHPSATAEERRKLLQAVMGIASDAAAIIPESMLIELLEVKNAGGGTSTPFEQICRFLDEQMSKMILGQTMTTEAGGSLAQAKVHNQIRIDILEDDADQLAVTINRDLIAHFVTWNFGENAIAPRVEFPVAEPEDIAVMASALAQLVPIGLEVDQAEVRNKLGLSEPDAGATLLVAKAPGPEPGANPAGKALKPAALNYRLDRASERTPVASGGLSGCPCCGETQMREAPQLVAAPLEPSAALNASEDQEDEVDRIGADEAQDWEPVMAPLLQAIFDAVEKAQSYEELQAALRDLTGGLDIGPLARRLAIAQMKARAFGNG